MHARVLRGRRGSRSSSLRSHRLAEELVSDADKEHHHQQDGNDQDRGERAHPGLHPFANDSVP